MTGIALGITIFACLSAGFLVGFVCAAQLGAKIQRERDREMFLNGDLE